VDGYFLELFCAGVGADALRFVEWPPACGLRLLHIIPAPVYAGLTFLALCLVAICTGSKSSHDSASVKSLGTCDSACAGTAGFGLG
jgi:hypothetical protein